MSKPNMTELNPPEKSRLYVFSGGEAIVLDEVTHFAASESGTHRLRTKDGKLHIVPPKWIHIEIDADDWTL